MSKSSGFTLIELLIVIAIILILIAIALPNFLEAQIRAKVTKSQGEIRSLGIAIESFRIDHNEMLVDFWDEGDPTALERLRRWNFCSPTNLADEIRNQRCILGNLTTPAAYITSIPTDPFSGTITDTSDRLTLALDGTYFYGDNESGIPGEDHGLGGLTKQRAWFFGLRPLGEDEWALMGWGPDSRIEELDGNERFRGLPYSPTNGTRSRGDIVTRG
ncbi:MAG: prepilin-type N-terminal cleavage/methylation domain-containing protein [Candidatus Omnitrophica bacterium]|nr:prepilin-type N-terminal cleavage/methylation domain-containing protein [Candidatus Omnitrophota bacterium]